MELVLALAFWDEFWMDGIETHLVCKSLRGRRCMIPLVYILLLFIYDFS